MEDNQHSDWGRELGDALQNALQSGDYTQLSKTINKSVQTAVDKTINCATKAERAAERIIDKNFSQFKPPNASGGSQYHPPKPPRPVHTERPNVPPPPSVAVVQQKSSKPVAIRRANGDTALGVLMATTGFLVAVPSLTATLLMVIHELTTSGINLLPLIAAAALGAVGLLSLVLALNGCRLFGRARRLRRYWGLAAEKGFSNLQQLADSVEKPIRFVIKDVKRMIALGAFPGGHLDDGKTCLIVGDDLYRQYREAQENLQRREEKEKFYEENAVFAAGADAIRQIRTANDALTGIEISDKLNKLEQVTTHIFAYVEERPNKLPDIRRFMDYYLPTAVKLVKSYQEFEAQPQTDSVIAAKNEIISILDTINQAFSKLLDGLFQEDVMDISTDISALKTMLAQEGLTNNAFDKEQTL